MTTKLATRKLGKNGPEVTRLGFGAMGLSAFYGPKKEDKERFAVLDSAYENGELFWDSANIYGDSEDLIGRWFEANPDKRKNVFLATKFGAFNPAKNNAPDSTPEHCRESVEKSLKRLKIDYIDLYYVHRLDKETPIEKTMEELKKLKSEGKIKHIGLSEVSAATLRRACKIEHVDAVQIEYSPFFLDMESPEIGLLQACRDLGVAVVAYSPLGRGFLSGKYRSPDDFDKDDWRRNVPRFSKENFPKNLALVDKIVDIAEKKGVTASQLTLAWLLAQGDDIFPIPGTTSVERLKENLGALSVKLTAEENDVIRKAIDEAEIHGFRYPEGFAGSLFADSPAL